MMFYRDRILSASQLKSLGEHKYNAVSVSFLDPWLQPWWGYLVSKTPLWLAPNLITATGLAVNILTSLVLMWYCPDARAEPPKWACLLCALGLLTYQSLDAIDGKQARITNTSSPLGELVDHGCDAISTVFICLAVCLAVRLGTYPYLMYNLCFVGITTFYCAHWKTYVTGTMRFGKMDATEAQTIIVLIHITSGLFGPDVWRIQVPYIELPIVFLFGSVTFILANVFVFKSVVEICSGGVGKNGSSIAGTSVLSPAIPFGIAVTSGYVIYWKSVEGVYENHPTLYVVAFGLVCAKVTSRLVIAHMTKTEIDYLDTALVGPGMLFFNQYFNFFLPEYAVLWMCLGWVVVDLSLYSWLVCREICEHLDIRLFHIPTPQQQQQKKVGVTSSSKRIVASAKELDRATKELEDRASGDEQQRNKKETVGDKLLLFVPSKEVTNLDRL